MIPEGVLHYHLGRRCRCGLEIADQRPFIAMDRELAGYFNPPVPRETLPQRCPVCAAWGQPDLIALLGAGVKALVSLSAVRERGFWDVVREAGWVVPAMN